MLVVFTLQPAQFAGESMYKKQVDSYTINCPILPCQTARHPRPSRPLLPGKPGTPCSSSHSLCWSHAACSNTHIFMYSFSLSLVPSIADGLILSHPLLQPHHLPVYPDSRKARESQEGNMGQVGFLEVPRSGGRSLGVPQVCAEVGWGALSDKFRCVRVPGGLPGHEGWGHEGGIEFGH